MHIIDYIKYIFLAIIQGISEVLPISSSGHLQVVQKYLGMDISSLTFSILLHFGSFIAMIIFYWKTIKNILLGLINYVFKKKRDEDTTFYARLSLFIIISSIPAGIIGFLLKSTIESVFVDIFYIGISFLITAILLLIIKNIKGYKNLKEMTYKDAFIIGLFQSIGIVPGISRSGITLIGNKVRKINSKSAFDYTFLLFLPVSFGSLILEIFDGNILPSSSLFIPYLVGILVSGLTTFLSLKLLCSIIKKDKLHYFAYYLIFIGIIIICLNI